MCNNKPLSVNLSPPPTPFPDNERNAIANHITLSTEYYLSVLPSVWGGGGGGLGLAIAKKNPRARSTARRRSPFMVCSESAQYWTPALLTQSYLYTTQVNEGDGIFLCVLKPTRRTFDTATRYLSADWGLRMAENAMFVLIMPKTVTGDELLLNHF